MDTNKRAEGFTRWNLTIIGLCSAIYLLDGLIHTVLGPLAPAISADLGLDNAALGPIFSANLIGQVIGLITFPLISGRFGHRAVILLSVCGFVVAQIATALAWDSPSLFAFRLVDGIFLGGCLPSCLATVAKVAPAARKGLAITLLFTGYGAGATMSGLLAAAFTGPDGWRTAILCIAGASLVCAVLGWIWLRGIDGTDAASGKPARKPRAIEVMGRDLLAGTLMLWLLFIMMLTVQYCLSSWLPTLLVDVGRDQAFAALSVTIFSLGGIIAALGVGLLIDRFGAIPVLASFLVIAAVLLFAIGQVLATASSAVLLGLLVAGGFFFLGAYGGINVVLASYYPEALSAIGIGLTKSVSRIGTIVAPILIGLALDAGMMPAAVMSLFAAPAVVAVGTLLVIRRQQR
jgi:MFS transporter, AAHS family, 4-hydroxybenzoate transporter